VGPSPTEPLIGSALRRASRRLRALLARPSRYDLETVAVMERVLRPDSACVDVGAHAGDILEHMARIAPRGRHHAFEPLPAFARRLRRDFPRAQVHEVALAERAGRAPFLHVVPTPGYSGLRRRVYSRPNPKVRTIEVEVATLDDSLPPDLPIAFLKIDVEGGEHGVLLGARRTLARWRPVVVFEAGAKSTGQYGVEPGQMYGLLGELGYRVTTMRRWLDGGPDLGAEEFADNWRVGPDYYFLAAP